MEHYFERIRPLIENIVNQPISEYVHKPTLFGDNRPETVNNLSLSHRVRNNAMREGAIAQIVFGNAPGWQDLGKGDNSKLDCKKTDGSAIMELKNKYNTTNAASEERLKQILSTYGENHPECNELIWGVVNPKAGEQNLRQEIKYKNTTIIKLQGRALFSYVFGDENVDCVIDFVRQEMYN